MITISIITHAFLHSILQVNSHIASGCKYYVLDQSRVKCSMKGCNETQMTSCKGEDILVVLYY